MKRIHYTILIAMSIMMTTTSAHAQAAEPTGVAKARIKDEEFTYESDGIKMKGYIAYMPNAKKKLPIVLVVPEWWGFVEYPKMRARMLAELGYFAMVVDMYGGGREAKTVEEAKSLSGAFYKSPALGVTRITAAERKAKSYAQIVDVQKVAAIGYCFGGGMVLNAAKMGMDFRGVVSFHGGLDGVPAERNKTTAKILVCQGGADKFVTEKDIIAFKKNLDTTGVKYGFRVYPGASHAFTNPDATATGKKFNLPIAYNAEADKRSWADMRTLLQEVFGK